MNDKESQKNGMGLILSEEEVAKKVSSLDEDYLLTIPETALFLRTTISTIRNYIKRGEIQAVLLPCGRLTRIRSSEVRRILGKGEGRVEAEFNERY